MYNTFKDDRTFVTHSQLSLLLYFRLSAPGTRYIGNTGHHLGKMFAY